MACTQSFRLVFLLFSIVLVSKTIQSFLGYQNDVYTRGTLDAVVESSSLTNRPAGNVAGSSHADMTYVNGVEMTELVMSRHDDPEGFANKVALPRFAKTYRLETGRGSDYWADRGKTTGLRLLFNREKKGELPKSVWITNESKSPTASFTYSLHHELAEESVTQATLAPGKGHKIPLSAGVGGELNWYVQ
ncbi:hypothetical protein PCANC_28484 [Puccinia coronata f. sp. avenae]|uniref:Uncharacterized protein n=1 Tax=Puccinia coronata f. sp. avenae TaxID=200324 RepID=A0A2N5THC0_9BASI|nr:hypothetical protein PCASD_26824 [Puccinia coronata f. sp. avenae]PLW24839.1 hypothetical protein PCANC_28484 [Puccinia coronata f. sp. avenae]PLW26838.1 hypothetical protein PCASD_26163 [Puccinia coronata f. sp. avenae]